MKAINILEKMGYRFNVAIDYIGPNNPPLEAQPLLAELTANREAAALYLAERNLQPSYIRASDQYKATITNGIHAAQNPYKLLVLAMECISRMTGDRLFYEQNMESLKAIYGTGILQPAPLEIELDEVRARLTMLTRPGLEAERDGARRRIGHAVKTHRAREAQLLDMICQGGNEQ